MQALIGGVGRQARRACPKTHGPPDMDCTRNLAFAYTAPDRTAQTGLPFERSSHVQNLQPQRPNVMYASGYDDCALSHWVEWIDLLRHDQQAADALHGFSVRRDIGHARVACRTGAPSGLRRRRGWRRDPVIPPQAKFSCDDSMKGAFPPDVLTKVFSRWHGQPTPTATGETKWNRRIHVEARVKGARPDLQHEGMSADMAGSGNSQDDMSSRAVFWRSS